MQKISVFIQALPLQYNFFEIMKSVDLAIRLFIRTIVSL